MSYIDGVNYFLLTLGFGLAAYVGLEVARGRRSEQRGTRASRTQDRA